MRCSKRRRCHLPIFLSSPLLGHRGSDVVGMMLAANEATETLSYLAAPLPTAAAAAGTAAVSWSLTLTQSNFHILFFRLREKT